MIISQLKLTNGPTLSLGDKIVVVYKPVIGDEESKNSITKQITIHAFKPVDDGSGEVFMVDEKLDAYFEDNFKSLVK